MGATPTKFAVAARMNALVEDGFDRVRPALLPESRRIVKVSPIQGTRWVAIAALLLAVPHAYAQQEEGSGTDDWIRLYEPHPDGELPYRLMSPLGMEPDRLYPVIVSLHGGAGRGTDNRKQLRVWTRHLADEAVRAAHPSYVLAPQVTRLWNAADLEQIKEIVAGLPAVDIDRIYVLGHSMGGHGSFVLMQIDPGYFAAAAPSAGTGLEETEEFIDASVIKDVPIWALHGDRDTVCPYERMTELFEEMGRIGGNLKLTTWVGDGHSVGAKLIGGGDNGTTRCASDRCDPEPDLMKWLFSHSLADRR